MLFGDAVLNHNFFFSLKEPETNKADSFSRFTTFCVGLRLVTRVTITLRNLNLLNRKEPLKIHSFFAPELVQTATTAVKICTKQVSSFLLFPPDLPRRPHLRILQFPLSLLRQAL